MNKDESNIHRWLAKRMLLSWFLMSVILIAIIYIYNIRSISNSATKFAIKEAAYLKEHYDDVKGLTDGATIHMDKAVKIGRFISVELYDKDQNLLYMSSLPDYSFIEKFTEEHDHSDLFKSTVSYSRKDLNSEGYLFVVAPIKTGDNIVSGYFEGIYHIDNAMLESIYNQIFYSIIIVILASGAATIIFYPIILRLNTKIIKHSDTLLASNLKMLEILGTATEKRDYDTNDHNIRVTLLSVMLGEAYGLRKDRLRGVIKGSMLHDVGKIGVPDNVLLKKGRLDADEMTIMRKHVTHGVEIIENHAWLEDALDIIQYHHEWYNGDGYMKGLEGNDIPIGARLFSIVDVFDALMIKRPYKEPYSFETTMSIIDSKRGTHFDPIVFDAFASNAKAFHETLYNKEIYILDGKMKELMAKYFRTTSYGKISDYVQ